MKTWFSQFVDNLKAALGHYSTYWTWFSAAAAAYWLQASPADQDWVLSFVPLVHLSSTDVSPLKGIATFLVGFIALKGWPQAEK